MPLLHETTKKEADTETETRTYYDFIRSGQGIITRLGDCILRNNYFMDSK